MRTAKHIELKPLTYLVSPVASIVRCFCFLLISVLLLSGLSGCSQLEIYRLNSIITTETAVVGNQLFLMGEINSKTYGQVREIIEAHPEIDTLVLTVLPGSLDDETNLKLCHYTREQRLNTHLLHNSVIASGAVDLFFAGVKRTMETGAKLGVHSWSDGHKEAVDYPKNSPAHTPYTQYYQRMLGSDTFYWYTIYAADANSIHWMSTDEIDHYSVLTAPVQHPSRQSTPFPSLEQVRQDVLSY